MKGKINKSTKQEVSREKDLETRLARALADYANLEKRYARESGSVVRFANASILQKLLTVRDHLELASHNIKDPSLAMILSSLDKLLQEEEVAEIKVDGVYDPKTMECEEQVEGDKDKIIKVITRGYTLGDRVLRPARVVVGNGQKNTSNKQ